MKFLVWLATAISRGLAFVGALCVVLMMSQITIDVVLRNVFRLSIPVTVETVSYYYMVGIAFLPLALVEMKSEMISVELVEFALSKTVLAMSDFLVLVVGATTYCVLTVTTGQTALRNWNIKSYVELVDGRFETSLSFFILPIGFGVAAFACVVLALDHLRPGATSPVKEPTI